MPTGIQDFPHDVLTIIAAHAADHCNKLKLVCKAFHRAIRTKTCSRYVLENRLRYIGRPLSDIDTIPGETFYLKCLAIYVEYWTKMKTVEKTALDTQIADLQKQLKELVDKRDTIQLCIANLPFYQKLKSIRYETRLRDPCCHYVEYIDDDAKSYLANDIVTLKAKIDIRALCALLKNPLDRSSPCPLLFLEHDIIALPAGAKKYYVLFVYRNGGLLATSTKVDNGKTYLPAAAMPFLQKFGITKQREIKAIHDDFVFHGYISEHGATQDFLTD